jgi:hypothetical protein
MREILGRRRMTRSTLRKAALTCAVRRHWPVLPGASVRSGDGPTPASCTCGDPACVVPGAHPLEPVLLAATTDPRMVGWWWTRRPDASLLLATGAVAEGHRAPCALSLPATAGRSALAEFDRMGVRVGPVIATPTRLALLVEPYELSELGELLNAQDRVPSSLRFHGDGGYVPLPPTPVATGGVYWERPPEDGEPHNRGAENRDGENRGAEETGGVRERRGPWLPRMESLLKTLVEASCQAPESGSRLAY